MKLFHQHNKVQFLLNIARRDRMHTSRTVNPKIMVFNYFNYSRSIYFTHCSLLVLCKYIIVSLFLLGKFFVFKNIKRILNRRMQNKEFASDYKPQRQVIP